MMMSRVIAVGVAAVLIGMTFKLQSRVATLEASSFHDSIGLRVIIRTNDETKGQSSPKGLRAREYSCLGALGVLTRGPLSRDRVSTNAW